MSYLDILYHMSSSFPSFVAKVCHMIFFLLFLECMYIFVYMYVADIFCSKCSVKILDFIDEEISGQTSSRWSYQVCFLFLVPSGLISMEFVDHCKLKSYFFFFFFFILEAFCSLFFSQISFEKWTFTESLIILIDRRIIDEMICCILHDSMCTIFSLEGIFVNLALMYCDIFCDSKCLGCIYVQRESKSSDFKGVSGAYFIEICICALCNNDKYVPNLNEVKTVQHPLFPSCSSSLCCYFHIFNCILIGWGILHL